MITTPPDKHAFLSYVSENTDEIDRLCRILDAANIPYWRDRTALGPGDMWRSKIRDAIKSDSLAFVVCFSKDSVQKGKSYQNEELFLAIEEFRMRPPGRTYLIPVRLDDCEIPAWELGAGQMLADVNYVDLFGEKYTENAVKLVEKIKQVMGLDVVDPAAVRTAIDEATDGDRPRLLCDLTKDMIRDPSREIELDELIGDEVSRVLDGMRDTTRFPLNNPGGTTEVELWARLAEISTDYWRLVEPFCWSLAVAARWGSPNSLGPWIKGIRALSGEAMKPNSGTTVFLDLRHIPALASTMVAAVASTGQGRWDNFKALLVENAVTDANYQNKRVAIIESVCPWEPFGYGEITPHVLAHNAKTGADFISAAGDFNKAYGKYHQPVADWLVRILRPLFISQFRDEDEYENAFDYAEMALGVVNEDLGNMRDTGDGRPLRFRNMWFGRSTWRYARHYTKNLDIADEYAANGATWKPLQAGLFGGSAERASAAIERYSETFREIASKQW